ERAQLLLTTENIAVKEVGYLLGFSDITYFNRVFRNITGISPTQFRQGYIKE
ncbi:MAG: AraC family transcriptional regulator, partial [Bacteroidales bacterium]|nr:AraC family transcriptional regulator [Bacteroidales bacterium]